MPNTTNFNFPTPSDTDLVKDGASAIRSLGNSIDTAFVDLKGGTTGQVLAKASNTDLDYTWTNVDPLTILDAKGDLITATAADTPARLALGTNNQVLTVDTSTSTGLKWAAVSAGPVLLSSNNLAGVSTITVSSISGSYKTLIVELLDSFDNSQEGIRLSANGVTTLYQRTNFRSSDLTIRNETAAASWELLDNGSSTSSRASFILTFPNYSKTNIRKGFFGYGQQPGWSRWMAGHNTGDTLRDAAISSITLTNNAVNWVGGTLNIYGEN